MMQTKTKLIKQRISFDPSEFSAPLRETPTNKTVEMYVAGNTKYNISVARSQSARHRGKCLREAVE